MLNFLASWNNAWRRKNLYDQPLTIEQLLSMLADAPERIAGFIAWLSADQLVSAAEPGEWSARDVLAHLRACSDMWGRYIGILLAEDRPTFKAVNPTTWIKQTNYLELEFQPSLEAYTAQREELLSVLKVLRPEDWSRTALVTGAGKPRERSVYTNAEWLANHERSHFRQLRHIGERFR